MINVNKIIVSIAITLVSLRVLHADKGQFRLLSYNFPSHNFGFDANGLPRITTTKELFRIVSPGLLGINGTVSFESVTYPGRYLRHRSYLLHLDSFREGNYILYKKDATFLPKHGKYFEGYIAYESYNIRGYFIRHQGFRLKISPAGSSPSALFQKDSSFKLLQDSTVVKTAPESFASANFPHYNIGFNGANLPIIVTVQRERFKIVRPGLSGKCGTASLESEKFPGHYLRHKNFLMHVSAFEERQVFFNDATFWIRNEIFLDGYVAFESTNYPNRYIRHQNYRLKLHVYDNTPLFRKDASFTTEQDNFRIIRKGPYSLVSKNFPTYTIGLDNSGIPKIITNGDEKFHVVTPGLTGEDGTVSLASERYPGHYLRHKNFMIHLDPLEETSVYYPDATFYLHKNTFFQGFNALESTNFRNFYIRHQNYRLKISRDDGSNLFRLDSSFKMVT